MGIYTGGGDDGTTGLMNQTRVPKNSPRIEAYGTVDEVNSLIGTIRPIGYDDVNETLKRVQNHLHIIQADLSDPDNGDNTPSLGDEHVTYVEDAIDTYDEEIDKLESFILPSGSEYGSRLHHARSVTRRAERRVVELASSATIAEHNIVYLNRLSDLLFTLARVVNKRDGVEEATPSY